MEIGEAKMGDPVAQILVLGRPIDSCMLKTLPVAAHLQTPAGASIALKSGIRRCRGTVPFTWRSSITVAVKCFRPGAGHSDSGEAGPPAG
jgi:hypothetical protein